MTVHTSSVSLAPQDIEDIERGIQTEKPINNKTVKLAAHSYRVEETVTERSYSTRSYVASFFDGLRSGILKSSCLIFCVSSTALLSSLYSISIGVNYGYGLGYNDGYEAGLSDGINSSNSSFFN